MTERPYGQVPSGAPEDSTAQVAAGEARGVAQDAKDGGVAVAQTAKDESLQVASEAKQQAKDLYHQVRGELSEQTSTQQRRAAGGMHTLADELGAMAASADQGGVASDLAQQAADRAHSLAQWLESREPGDVVTELKGFARRKPGTFLAAAAAIGFLGGRLTRGLAADGAEGGRGSGSGSGAPVPPGFPETLDADYGDRGLAGGGLSAPVPVQGVSTPGGVPAVTGMSHGVAVTYPDGSAAGLGTLAAEARADHRADAGPQVGAEPAAHHLGASGPVGAGLGEGEDRK